MTTATIAYARPSVPRLWPGSTIVCLASGPSLTQADVDYVRGKARVIVVNTTYQMAPWADVLHAGDAKWWRWHSGVPEFRGLKYSLEGTDPAYGVTMLRGHQTSGLHLAPDGLANGRNSGYQAINLAVHLGAARIILLGYDLQRGPNGEEHHHPDHPLHPSSLTEPSSIDAKFLRWRAQFATLVAPLAALGIEAINCTRRTALTCFPCRPLEETL